MPGISAALQGICYNIWHECVNLVNSSHDTTQSIMILEGRAPSKVPFAHEGADSVVPGLGES
eukprot:1138005-Pelagomonas_calceolata.AAC.4